MPSITTVHSISKVVLHRATGGLLDQPQVLGPLDHLVAPFIPVAVVFAYTTDHANGEVLSIGKLQKAIEVLLDSYPLLTGRLHIDPTTGRREISNFTAGAELHLAESKATLSSFATAEGSLLITNLPDGGNALLAPFDMSMDAISINAMLTVQHTRFSCGGVTLGIRMPHALCDSDGYFQVVRDLAEVYRTGSLARQPHLQPFQVELLTSPSEQQRAEDRAFKPSLYYVDEPKDEESAAVQPAPSQVTPPPALTTGRVVRYTAQKLDELKDLASAPGKWVSTFDALSAYLCRRITLAKLASGIVPPDLMSRDFLTSVNYRGTDRLNTPSRYLYNCILTPTTTLPSVHETTLAETSQLIHDLVRRVSADEAQRSVRWIAAQPDTRAIRWRFDPRPGSFMVSAWNKFDVYAGTAFELDEEGKGIAPLLVAPPFTPISLVDGLVYYLPTEKQATDTASRDLDVYIALSEPVWTVLDKDHSLERWIVD